MDIYVSPKIKATVKSVGIIILLLFYSSLVDFYYIGPYIHNTLGQIKYTTEKMLVNGQDIENNFLDMNVMFYDTISFFNGFNRNFVKDMENFLKTNVVFNERLFLNLRGLSNSDEIMNMCRDYSGGQKYAEVIKSGKIKPKMKSKENISKNPKNDEKIKIEGDESNMFRFLKFKKKVKKKMFLDEDFNMIDFPEYIDDYERTFLKMDFEETAKIITPEANMLEIYDFINNIIVTDKDKQALNKKKTMNLSKDNKNASTDIKNDVPDILSMFAMEDKDKKENKKKEGKEKENNSNNLIFDFSTSLNNENEKEKVKENNNNDLIFDFPKSQNNENKDEKGKSVGVDSFFDFLPNINKESNKESKLSKIENKEDTNKNKDNKQSDQNKNNENLFDFDNIQNSNQKNDENQKQKNNNENQKQKNNDETSFDFSNFQKSNPNNEQNQKQKNNNETSFDFSNFQKSNQKKDENQNKKNNNTNSFEFNIQKSKQKNEENKEQNNNNSKKEKENESPGLNGNSLDNTANKRGTKTSEKSKNNNFINNENESNEIGNFNQKKNNGNQNKPLFNFNINNNNNTRSSFNNNNGFNFNNANQSNQQFFSSFNQNINKSSNFNFGNFGFNNSSNNFEFFQQKDEEKIKVELEEKNWFYLNLQKQENIINIKNEGSLGLICDKEINKNKNFKMEFLFENFNNSQYIRIISLLKPEKIGEFTYMINLNKLKKSQQLLKYQLNSDILANQNILMTRIYPNNNELKFGFIYNNYIQKTIKTIDLFVNYNNFLQDYKNIETDGKIKEESSLQLHLSYEGKINEANIKYPEATVIGPLVKQITIQVALEDDVMSDFNVEIIDIENQESLQIVKSCQIFYDFSYLYS